jgi:hypothetical protein
MLLFELRRALLLHLRLELRTLLLHLWGHGLRARLLDRRWTLRCRLPFLTLAIPLVRTWRAR